MSQDLLLLEEVDVRRTLDPDDTRVLTITKMGLAKLDRKTAEHTPGGGIGTVEFLLPMLNALAPTFSVKGLDRGTLREFGFAAGQSDRWTFAGAVRNVMTNQIIPVRATIEGIVADWSPGEHTPGELIDCDHTLKEVKYYDLFIDGVEDFAWGWKERIFRAGGIDVFAPYKTALGA